MSFSSFGLKDQIAKAVQAMGYTVPTKIQLLAIPPLMEGKDVVGCAQTGTGKTAAFVLPMLHRLWSPASGGRRTPQPRALVLAPTRELAQQVQAATAEFARFTGLRSVTIYGGAGMERQVELLRRGPEIVVATPGRLLDHMQRRTIDLSKVEILVLDEADRMLDMGFIHDVKRIIAAIPAERQTSLFSATLSPEIISLSKSIVHEPVTLDAGGRHNPIETVSHSFYAATRETKMPILLHALESDSMESVLVFARTKHSADKISQKLERQGINATSIHSDRSQSQRERALAGFREGKFRVLVATEVAARGLDITGISHVVNYDIPEEGESYVHRIGRTGRAGETGSAITFVASEDRQFVKRIEQFTRRKFQVAPYPGEIRAEAPTHSVAHRPASAQRPEVRPSRPAFVPRQGKPKVKRRKGFEFPVVRKKKPAKPLSFYSSDQTSWSD